MPVIIQARCGDGRARQGRGPCVVNLVLDDPAPVYFRRRYDEGDGTGNAWYWGTLPAKEATPYLVMCIAHQQRMHGQRLRASVSTSPCDDACTMATGNTCRCECGGINHGIEAP